MKRYWRCGRCGYICFVEEEERMIEHQKALGHKAYKYEEIDHETFLSDIAIIISGDEGFKFFYDRCRE